MNLIVLDWICIKDICSIVDVKYVKVDVND